MSAPLMWVLFPIAVAILIYMLPDNKTAAILFTGFSFFLAFLAIIIPPDLPLVLLGSSIKISPTLVMFGRSFTLNSTDQPALILAYTITGFWYLLGLFFDMPRRVLALAMIITALMVASISVQPFLYSAIIIELASLVLIPAVVTDGSKTGRGALKFLISQTLGMPFILLAGFLLSGVEAGPNDLAIVQQAMMMLSLGFGFYLAIFPFFSWAPQLAEEIEPHLLAFILIIFSLFTTILGLEFIDRYAWLRNSLTLYPVLKLIGSITLITASFWAAFERHVGRFFAYIMASATGYSLLILSVGHTNEAVNLFLLTAIMNCVVLLALGVALNIFTNITSKTDLTEWVGIGRRSPILPALIILCLLSYTGLPLLAHFPSRMMMMEDLGTHDYTFWVILASMAALLVTTYRLASIFFSLDTSHSYPLPNSSENKWFGIITIGLIIVLGIFPSVIPSFLYNIADNLPNLVR